MNWIWILGAAIAGGVLFGFLLPWGVGILSSVALPCLWEGSAWVGFALLTVGLEFGPPVGTVAGSIWAARQPDLARSAWSGLVAVGGITIAYALARWARERSFNWRGREREAEPPYPEGAALQRVARRSERAWLVWVFLGAWLIGIGAMLRS